MVLAVVELKPRTQKHLIYRLSVTDINVQYF